ncbi:hypothetical protein H8356DRAFT_1421641 [Neocallimastix lanati (nom. inval.)]|nr:hypothetical protein H8356DRAFT_1421641 [Neocallimastix sp. JGI-2020a]
MVLDVVHINSNSYNSNNNISNSIFSNVSNSIENNVYIDSSVCEKVFNFLLGGRSINNSTREWKDLFKCQMKSGAYSDTPFLVVTAALLQSIIPIAIGQQWSMFNRFKSNRTTTTKSVNAEETVRQASRASATNEDHNFSKLIIILQYNNALVNGISALDELQFKINKVLEVKELQFDTGEQRHLNEQLLKTIPNFKACGPDGIPLEFFKDLIPHLHIMGTHLPIWVPIQLLINCKLRRYQLSLHTARGCLPNFPTYISIDLEHQNRIINSFLVGVIIDDWKFYNHQVSGSFEGKSFMNITYGLMKPHPIIWCYAEDSNPALYSNLTEPELRTLSYIIIFTASKQHENPILILSMSRPQKLIITNINSKINYTDQIKKNIEKVQTAFRDKKFLLEKYSLYRQFND